MIATILTAALVTCSAGSDNADLADSTIMLQEVSVSGQRQRDYQMRTSQSSIQVNREFLRENLAGSLMQTLEGLPGVKAMSIGSGQSKPTIRGLGFNRMAVVEDGVKHEGQQWGDDHGLEIDQFAIDHAEVIKGPAALLYGSDAIGGVLNLFSNHIPTDSFAGILQLFGSSNNEQLGVSAKVGGRKDRWFYRANATLIDYADYRVPTDSIQYYSYWIHLKDQRLRNTAGCERDGSLMLGYAGQKVLTSVRISDSYSKSGFFANAHGMEVRLSDIDYDRSRRDIDLPYQWVNHLKVLGQTSWCSGDTDVKLNVAYQNNLREELSEPVSHGYMPTPDDPLERRFDKHTGSALVALRRTIGNHELRSGLSAEYQHNRCGGWGFILPDFETATTGIYFMERYTLRKELFVNAGVRYDYARTHIHSYYDWFKTPIGLDSVYVMRSAEMTRRFHSLTWSAGINYATELWTLKTNVGKSFRVPIPKEMGADGINYHIFRYERGNPQLDPEESYQIDASASYDPKGWHFQVEPYLNYFPNYIYLSPTSQYVEGLQLYHYTQARVLRYGLEALVNYEINRRWLAELQGEYLWARQQSGEKKGYTLPFSIPWSIDTALKYRFGRRNDGFVRVAAHIVGQQDEIVPPEKPTEGYWTLNLSAGKQLHVGKQKLNVAFQANNLLDRRYYDHTSYYRLIDVPEPGRNISATVGLEF